MTFCLENDFFFSIPEMLMAFECPCKKVDPKK